MKNQWEFFSGRLLKKVRFEREGALVDVILQNYITKEVLFGASMSKETLEETIEKGVVVLFSRSRRKRWLKGETSGNFLKFVNILLNCEKNQLLIQVLLVSKGVCHKTNNDGTAKPSCFYRLLATKEIVEIDSRFYRAKNGKKEEVCFYVPYGWLSVNELFELRQKDPRYAP